MNEPDAHHNILEVRKPVGHWQSTHLDVFDHFLLRAQTLLHRCCPSIKPNNMGEV